MSELPPTEVPALYLRPAVTGFLTELVIEFGDDTSEVYILRPSQLAKLAVDSTFYALAKFR